MKIIEGRKADEEARKNNFGEVKNREAVALKRYPCPGPTLIREPPFFRSHTRTNRVLPGRTNFNTLGAGLDDVEGTPATPPLV
jgi:hypothetical protein